MKTFKQIEAMPLHSPVQVRAVDEWYQKFMSFHYRHNTSVSIWECIHNSFVGYGARYRWLYKKTSYINEKRKVSELGLG